MFIGLFFSSRRRHTRCALVTEFRRVLFRSLPLGVTEGRGELGNGTTLWLECNAAELNGVSFSKGCYVGQENTARMNWRQKVNRRLVVVPRSEEHTSELQSLMRISYAVFCLKKKKNSKTTQAPEMTPTINHNT